MSRNDTSIRVVGSPSSSAATTPTNERVVEELTIVARNTLNPLQQTPVGAVRFQVNGVGTDAITNTGTTVSVNTASLPFNISPGHDCVEAIYEYAL